MSLNDDDDDRLSKKFVPLPLFKLPEGLGNYVNATYDDFVNVSNKAMVAPFHIPEHNVIYYMSYMSGTFLGQLTNVLKYLSDNNISYPDMDKLVNIIDRVEFDAINTLIMMENNSNAAKEAENELNDILNKFKSDKK